MRSFSVCLLLLACGAILHGGDGDTTKEADRKAIHMAVLDYVEGVYNVQPERIERSVHPKLAKVGFYQDKEGAWKEVPMTFDRLVKLAATYNKDGWIAADAPKEITILDMESRTASAKLIAQWGMDYFHLAKYDGVWKITNVIWQSLPERKE